VQCIIIMQLSYASSFLIVGTTTVVGTVGTVVGTLVGTVGILVYESPL
jgi:predicted ABC-type sugar transport system permease subunit